MNGVDVPKRIELLLGVKVSVGVNGRTGVDSDLIAGKTGVSVVLEEALSEAESSAIGFVGGPPVEQVFLNFKLDPAFRDEGG
jgi:hypothetical protein